MFPLCVCVCVSFLFLVKNDSIGNFISEKLFLEKGGFSDLKENFYFVKLQVV